MSKLILNPEFKLYERKGQAFCSSRQIANETGKRHSDILRDIEVGIEKLKQAGERKFAETNFVFSTYRDSQNKKQPEVLLKKDGFVYITMGYSGKKATKFKVAYINKYNAMEEFITSLATAKLEFPEFTQAILMAHEEPKHYHFSNEINMINRIVLGMDAKGFKKAKGLDPKTPSIRPYLTTWQIKMIESLQRADISLIVMIPDYKERRMILENYFAKLSEFKQLKAV